jgi:hypothetical protein
MKVKTFTGTDTKRVDKQVNDWLEKSGAKVLKTNTAIKQFTVRGPLSEGFIHSGFCKNNPKASARLDRQWSV